MKQALIKWLEAFGLADTEYAYFLVVIGLIVIASSVLHVVLHRIVARFLSRARRTGRTIWQRAFSGHKLFSRLALALQGVVVFAMASAFLDAESLTLQFIEALTHLWIILFSLLSLFSLLDAVEEISRSAGSAVKLPLRGIFQSLKLVGTTVALIFAVAFLIGKSPVILFSGLGAMTAVVLLIFKDPILGLVAGIQLSANNMLSVGDWLEMQKYGADGDVIDISLTTVKVRNWDKTITSIPSYALISDSFKNWRNIEEVGGRRIKRAVNIDATSIRFVEDDDLQSLSKIRLLSDYIESKSEEIDKANKARGVDPNAPVNARKMTNIGLLRAYLTAYLRDNENINHDLTFMVRQLEAGPNGIPLQVYGFANQTSWVPYENIQSDIFDHIYAIIPAFGLRLHQAPSGYDFQKAAKRFARGSLGQQQGEES
ncbi:MAG TPA: mechanosensitive ion channel family protein [Wenzhouxiangellaceae bacterium]|nr:mechanosensitive ion channel family protein [Wenzhouxiangellaceae bacterium]